MRAASANGPRVLDVGAVPDPCGGRRPHVCLGHELVGIHVAQVIIEGATTTATDARLRFRTGVAANLPFPAGSLGLVVRTAAPINGSVGGRLQRRSTAYRHVMFSLRPSEDLRRRPDASLAGRNGPQNAIRQGISGQDQKGRPTVHAIFSLYRDRFPQAAQTGRASILVARFTEATLLRNESRLIDVIRSP
jgi:hypothetical protein